MRESPARVVFTAPGVAELQAFKPEPVDAGEGSLLVETLYTLISTGTELAWFSGMQMDVTGSSFSYPVYSGYCHAGRVVEISGVGDGPFSVGDVVVSGAPHASVVRIPTDPKYEVEHSDLRQPVAVVPQEIPDYLAPFAKIGEIAMTAIRIADFTLGEKVLVVGQGMVGNLAAQLFQLAGADVLAADVSDFRLERSRASGIVNAVNPESTEFKAIIDEWTLGQGADVTVDTTGNSAVLLESVQWTRRLGELIVLGTPRKRVDMNPSPHLWQAHMRGVTIKGALRCLFYPLNHSKLNRRSVARDLEEVLLRMARDQLKIEPLRGATYQPEDCQEAFDALLNAGASQMGVVLDWRPAEDGR